MAPGSSSARKWPPAERLAAHVGGVVAPHVEHVVGRPTKPSAPQSTRAGHSTRRPAAASTSSCSRSIEARRGSPRSWPGYLRVAEAAHVLLDRLGREGLDPRAARPLRQLAAQVVVRVGADQALGQVGLLGQEEPVVVGLRQGPVDVGEHVPGRDDVEQRHPGDRLGMVEAQAVRDPGAAVVADDARTVEAEVVA